MTRRRRIAAWIAGTVLALLAALAILVASFDWNRARPWIDRRVGDALGRPFHIGGDLDLRWGRAPGDWLPGPVFVAHDVRVGNPSWASGPWFAHVDGARIHLRLLPLLAHRIEIPSIDLRRPDVRLEQQGEKRANWHFAAQQADTPSDWHVQLGTIGFDAGTLGLRDASTDTDVHVDIRPLGTPIPFADIQGPAPASSTPGVHAGSVPAFAFAFKAGGRYHGAAVHGDGRTGGVLALRAADRPFPLQADVRIGDVRLQLAGTLTDPAALGAVDLDLRLAGNSMAHLYPVLGVTLPDTPPFRTRGHLDGRLGPQRDTFTYRDFDGRVGGSDLHGTLTYVQQAPRPRLTGTLRSDRLRLADLGPLIGLDTGDRSAAVDARPPGDTHAPRRPAKGKVLPDQPFRTDRWDAMDADVRFRGRHFEHGDALPIRDLQARIRLHDGALEVAPLDFGVADGSVQAAAYLDGRAAPMKGRVELGLHHLQLRQLLPRMKSMRDTLGEINGDVALSATGNSVAALLGSADGEVKLLMDDGVVSRELMELAGLNVGTYVVVKLFGDEPVPIHCAAADLAANDGVMHTRMALVDTDNALVDIDGKVDFGSERMDLDITPHTKGLRVLSLRSPLYVRGTFADPDVGVHAGKLLLRGGAAVALGVFAAPAAALVPLIAPSKDRRASPCAGLLHSVRGKAEAPPAGHDPG